MDLYDTDRDTLEDVLYRRLQMLWDPFTDALKVFQKHTASQPRCAQKTIVLANVVVRRANLRINRPEPIVLVHFGPYAQFLHFGDHRGEPMYFGDHVISPCTLESIEKILGCLQPVLCIWSRYNSERIFSALDIRPAGAAFLENAGWNYFVYLLKH